MARRLHDEGSFDKGEGDTAALESARTKKSAISTSRKNRRIKRKLLRRNLSSEKLTPPEERDVPAADPKIDDGGASSLDDKVSEVIISPRELVSKSQIVDKLYVESTRYFKAVDRSAFLSKDPRVTTRDEVEMRTPLHVAAEIQHSFGNLSRFCQGILAGISLWQCVVVEQQLVSPMDAPGAFFLLLKPFKIAFYILSIVCTVASLDRLDIGSVRLSKDTWDDLVPRCRELLVTIIYLVTFLVHLATHHMDDQLSRHNIQDHERVSPQNSEVQLWRLLNLFRCLGAVLGWSLLASSSRTDRTLERLDFKLGCADTE